MAHMTMSYIHYYWCLKQTLTYNCSHFLSLSLTFSHFLSLSLTFSHFLSISGGAPYRWFEELLFVKSASGGGVRVGGVRVGGVRVGGVHADSFYPAVMRHQLNNYYRLYAACISNNSNITYNNTINKLINTNIMFSLLEMNSNSYIKQIINKQKLFAIQSAYIIQYVLLQ